MIVVLVAGGGRRVVQLCGRTAKRRVQRLVFLLCEGVFSTSFVHPRVLVVEDDVWSVLRCGRDERRRATTTTIDNNGVR